MRKAEQSEPWLYSMKDDDLSRQGLSSFVAFQFYEYYLCSFQGWTRQEIMWDHWYRFSTTWVGIRGLSDLLLKLASDQ